jgi:hypothetical protein
MRSINVWAFHTDFGTLCRDARLDTTTGLSYPEGDQQGQADWHVAVPFGRLDELAKKFTGGISMPSHFCGNLFQDCDPIQRGEVVRLAIMAHGNKGAIVAVNGKADPEVLYPDNVDSFHSSLHTIGLFTREKSTILFASCLAGQGDAGTRLLVALSKIWPARWVVGFSTVGYREPGMMKRRGEPCELPGVRDTDATDELYVDSRQKLRFAKQWNDFKKMPWTSEGSINAKVVRDGIVGRCPPGELCTKNPAPPTPDRTRKEPAAKKRAK